MYWLNFSQFIIIYSSILEAYPCFDTSTHSGYILPNYSNVLEFPNAPSPAGRAGLFAQDVR